MAESKQKRHVGMVVVGHAQAGKSSTIGRLMYEQGMVDENDYKKAHDATIELAKPGSTFAFFVDKTKGERSRGMTINTNSELVRTSNFNLTVIDVPGHRDFTKNMIAGTSQADVALLIIPASEGDYEASMQRGDHKKNTEQGQTRHHARLLHIIGVDQIIVCVNKMDCTKPRPYSEYRFKRIETEVKEMLSKIGFRKPNRIAFIPISSLQGDNIVEKSDNMKWYRGFYVAGKKKDISGYTLLDALDKVVRIPTRRPNKPLRMPVRDIYHSGEIVAGRIEQGTLTKGTNVTFTPSGCSGKVVSIQMHHKKMNTAIHGDICGVKIEGNLADLTTGDVMSIEGENDQNPPTNAESFRAVVFVQDHPGQLKVGADNKQGFTPIIHVRTARAPCQLVKILWKRGPSTHNEMVRDPEFIECGDSAEVIFVPQTPLCVQKYEVCRSLGRFAATTSNYVILLGRVIDVKDQVSKENTPS